MKRYWEDKDPVKKPKTVQKWVRLTPEQAATIEALAKAEHRPVAYQLATLIAEALAAREGKR